MAKLLKLFALPSIGLQKPALVLAILLALSAGYRPAVAQQITAQNSNMSHTPTAHQTAHALPIPLYRPNGQLFRGPKNEYYSGNWSGYGVLGNSLSAQGTWTVPAVSYAQYPGSPSIEKSSTWIGIGALSDITTANSDNTLIQLGAEQDVDSSGVASYSVWYEMLPAFQVNLPSQYTVSAGDVITAYLLCTANCTPNAQQTWSLRMSNSTKNWSWSDTFTYASSLASAEWIQEATSLCSPCVIQALPDYGSAGFSGVYLNAGLPNLSSSNEISLIDGAGGYSTPCAAANPIVGFGNQFFVDYGVLCTSNSVQFTQQSSKLVALGAIGSASQGYRVALSADGNTAIVGADGDNGGVGAAWVLERIGGVWYQGPKLVGNGSVGYSFQGTSVAISADGNTVIVGGGNDNSGTGAAWVFINSNGVWTQQGFKLVGSDVLGSAQQGASIALSADGNTAIVGGSGDNSGVGAAWVFTRSNGVWAQQGPKLIGTGALGTPSQGWSVALSADGNTAFVGGPNGNSGAGAGWVFTRSGSTWAQQGSRLVGSNANGNAQQGISVALSGDGNTAIIGGFADNTDSGAAWIFIKTGGVWTQQGPKLIGAGAVGGKLILAGWSVALSSDGNTAIVGGPNNSAEQGGVWVFARSSSSGYSGVSDVWIQQGWPLLGSGAVGTAEQGSSVALSADASTAIVGGPGDNSSAGAVWAFAQLLQIPTVTAVAPTKGPAGTTVTITGTNFAEASAVKFGSVSSQFNATSATSITAISPPGVNTVDVTVTNSAGTSATSVADQFTYIPASHDFNGDGMSDILWRDSAGDVGMWLMNGTQILQGAAFNSVGTNWSIVGQRDFNGDGKSDILWRDTAGDVGMWLMNGTQIIQSGSFSAIPLNWSVAGTGDFNGDGKADILWLDNQGNVGIWFMNGTQILQAGVVGQLPPNWIIVGSDMKGDIFLRNISSGDVGMWVMNGIQVAQAVDFGPVSLNWTIAGIGDFDGNGSFDLFWRDTTGDVAIWLMNGTSIMSTKVLQGNVSANWTIVETGDFNGDGYSDILWRDTAGDVAIWFMNGTTVLSPPILGNVGTNWTVQSLGAD